MARPVGFSEEGARRVVRATRNVERQYKLPPPPRGKYGAPYFSGTKCAKTGSGGVSAKTGSTPGSGTGGIIYDVSSGSLVQDHLYDGTKFYNNMTSAVAGSKDVQVVWIDGLVFVAAEDC